MDVEGGGKVLTGAGVVLGGRVEGADVVVGGGAVVLGGGELLEGYGGRGGCVGLGAAGTKHTLRLCLRPPGLRAQQQARKAVSSVPHMGGMGRGTISAVFRRCPPQVWLQTRAGHHPDLLAVQCTQQPARPSRKEPAT